LKSLLHSVRDGSISVDDAVQRMRSLPFEDLGFAKVDHHRHVRCGQPEVIYGEGKTPEQLVAIFERRAAQGNNVLATRVSTSAVTVVRAKFPSAEHNELARTIVLRQAAVSPPIGTVTLVAAGTSDLSVAEEARVTAELMGQSVESFYDVGVAGIHRLLSHAESLQKASVIIVVAGMEGALASVVGGLVDCPVIAVPTSIGYGASFGGLAALLAMLNSCASGVSVVNIDNGFAAGYIAALINRKVHEAK
jgi:pyridinium-3,5-biscarboxylic acid mononucleotide synthase